jgi:HPt (histidine-containing phosphotransfer) domain-containing protein
MATIDQSALQKLLDLIGGDKNSLAELIRSFLTEAPALLETLQQAADRHDIEAVRRATHTLKSSARDFGAVALGEHCAAVEAQCRAGQPTDCHQQITAITDEFETVRLELESFTEKLN